MNLYDELDEIASEYPMVKIKRRGIDPKKADKIIHEKLMIQNAFFVDNYFEGVFIAEKTVLTNRILSVEISYEVGKDFYACCIYDDSKSNGVVFKAGRSGVKELVEVGTLDEEFKKDIKKVFEMEVEKICLITTQLSQL